MFLASNSSARFISYIQYALNPFILQNDYKASYSTIVHLSPICGTTQRGLPHNKKITLLLCNIHFPPFHSVFGIYILNSSPHTTFSSFFLKCSAHLTSKKRIFTSASHIIIQHKKYSHPPSDVYLQESAPIYSIERHKNLT